MEKDLVFKGENGQVLTNSLLVAEKFEKNHRDVMRAISDLFVSAQNCAETDNQQLSVMFALSEYEVPLNNGTGAIRKVPMYVMTRDGFTLLAMGFTGEKALRFKLDYIEAFNEMEKSLRELQKPLSQLEVLAQSVQLLLEQEKRVAKVEARLDAIDEEREANKKALFPFKGDSTPLPEMSRRDEIRQLVNRYATATNTRHNDVWHAIYDKLYYLYHVSINSYKRSRGQSLLDVAEKNGLLDKMYNIISEMVKDSERLCRQFD